MKLWMIDAFTDKPFAGNPAAVCVLDHQRDDDWMQSVAAEMNLSETAFVRGFETGFELRWFTPAIEVELCGHATLASAHALWSEGLAGQGRPIHFHTKSVVLPEPVVRSLQPKTVGQFNGHDLLLIERTGTPNTGDAATAALRTIN